MNYWRSWLSSVLDRPPPHHLNLGGCVAAVKIEIVSIDLLSDAHDAVLENPLQAAVAAPLAIVMIADFFFVRSSLLTSMGKRSH